MHSQTSDADEAYVSIPMGAAPKELAAAHPGQEVTISAVFRVKSLSEDCICGCLEEIAVEEVGEWDGPPKDDEGEKEGEDADETSGPDAGLTIVVGKKGRPGYG